MVSSFAAFMERATRDPESGVGMRPYRYQETLAEDGLPELLRVPTGAGKTVAAVLPWLWRLTRHPDHAVRSGTPRWLVYVLPMRSLVEQTAKKVQLWLRNLDADEQVGLHVLMGGEDRDDDAWRLRPHRPAVFVGTQDMLLSRLLNRGYGERRSIWPVSFGLLNSGVQFVFDETQLMGPALPTSVQLQAFRDAMGTGAPTATLWMSATVTEDELVTVDRDEPPRAVELPDEDRAGGLARRLGAVRRFEHADVPEEPARYPSAVAELLVQRHVPGTRTIAFFNQVPRATAVAGAVRKLLAKAEAAPEVVLVHGHFRPAERRSLDGRISEDPGTCGQIVVSTQVLEAGVDVSSRLMLTEAASWSSVVQRLGRCNRAGEYEEAEVVWTRPPKGRGWSAPYLESDVEATVAALDELSGRRLTTAELDEYEVEQEQPVHLTLRRRDLLQLWDTMPDLSGADIDVSQWIRDGEDVTASVAWRTWPTKRPDPKDPLPGREELCPAPVVRLRTLSAERRVWLRDQLEGGWRRAVPREIRPGGVYLMDAALGGYERETGFSPTSRKPVPVVTSAGVPADDMRSDRDSQQHNWVDLLTHLRDAERQVAALLSDLAPLPGLAPQHTEALLAAALHHDLGKAHKVFKNTIEWCPAGESVPGPGPWAKSPFDGGRHSRRYFRHELVTALALLHPDSHLLDGFAEPDLVTYLAAAHHGKARLSIRSVGDEASGDPPRLLGVEPGDTLGPLELPDGRTLPRLELDPQTLLAGTAESEPWARRVLRLRDRPDLGPFRLGLLEALLRVADWEVSRTYRGGADASVPPQASAGARADDSAGEHADTGGPSGGETEAPGGSPTAKPVPLPHPKTTPRRAPSVPQQEGLW